jgi:hypothetical protein
LAALHFRYRVAVADDMDTHGEPLLLQQLKQADVTLSQRVVFDEPIPASTKLVQPITADQEFSFPLFSDYHTTKGSTNQ